MLCGAVEEVANFRVVGEGEQEIVDMEEAIRAKGSFAPKFHQASSGRGQMHVR